MNRRTVLALVAATAVFSAVVGWAAGQQIKSPAEIAADAEPPTASLITVPVEERELSTSVVIRGQVEFDDVAEIPVNPSASGSTIITATPKAVGDLLAEGEVAIEVASRPLFVLEGELPVFRPLGPGVEGPDVRQLEEALARLGFDPGTVDDTYDNGTEAAVRDFYRSAGYAPDEPSTADLEQLEAARQRVRGANQALIEARRSAENAGVPESVRLSLDQQVRQAEEFLADTRGVSDTEIGVAQAEFDRAEAAEAGALAAVETADSRLAIALSGTDPDTGNPVTPQRLKELREALDQAEATLASAEEFTLLAEGVLAKTVQIQGRLVGDAQTSLAIAIANRKETLAGFDQGSSGAELIRAAEAELRAANEALATLDRSIGTSFPSSELLFLPELPREVQTVGVSVGDVPQGTAMTVTGSGLVIRSSVSAADRPLVRDGAEGMMEDTNLGISIPVRVAFVADTPGGPNAGTDRFAVRLEPLVEVPEDAYNQNLRVTLPFESTGGAVLAVPLAALSAGADGSSRVQVERPDGTVEIVTVQTGLLARSVGLVEITPVDGLLAAGDRVVVGRDNTGAGSDAEPGADNATSESEE